MMNIQPSAILCWKLVAVATNSCLFVRTIPAWSKVQGIGKLWRKHHGASWKPFKEWSMWVHFTPDSSVQRYSTMTFHWFAQICLKLGCCTTARKLHSELLLSQDNSSSISMNFALSFLANALTVQGETSTLSVLSTNETFNLVQQSAVVIVVVVVVVVVPCCSLDHDFIMNFQVFTYVQLRFGTSVNIITMNQGGLTISSEGSASPLSTGTLMDTSMPSVAWGKAESSIPDSKHSNIS